MAFRSHLRHALVATALMVMVGACVDTPAGVAPEAAAPDRPVTGRTPTSDEEFLRAPITTELDAVARYTKRPHAQDYWIKQWIGPRGGTVDFLGFRIVVPPGAVSRVTKFQIRIPGDNDPDGQEHAVAEFGPHNVAFAVPVRIELPYASTDAFGYNSSVVWFNERAKEWVPIGGGVTADGQRVFVDVWHFSTYAKAAAVSSEGGGTASGGGG